MTLKIDFMLTGSEGKRSFNDLPSWHNWLGQPESEISRFGPRDEWADRRAVDPRAFDLERLDHLKHLYVDPPELDAHIEDITDILRLNFAADGVRDPIAISSPGGADGKTTFTARFLRSYCLQVLAMGRSKPVEPGNRDRHEPVVFVTQSDDTRVTRFDEGIIAAFGEPIPSGPLGRHSIKVRDLIQDCETSVLVVDDIHLLRAFQSNELQLLNHLKMLMSQLSVTLFIVGIDLVGNRILSEGDDGYLYLNDPERGIQSSTEGRFTLVELPRYKIKPKYEMEKFRTVVTLFEEQLPLMKHVPGTLATDEMVRFIYERTSGALQPLRQLMTRAALRAITTGKERLDKAALERAPVSVGADDARPAARRVANALAAEDTAQREHKANELRKRDQQISTARKAIAKVAERETP